MKFHIYALIPLTAIATLALLNGNQTSAQCPYSVHKVSMPAAGPAAKAAGSLRHTSDASFKQDVLESSTPVLVDFYASWCRPCMMLAPIFESASKSYEGKVAFYKIDVDKNPEISAKYGITSIPSIKLFKGGRVAESLSGLQSETDLKELVQRHL